MSLVQLSLAKFVFRACSEPYKGKGGDTRCPEILLNFAVEEHYYAAWKEEAKGVNIDDKKAVPQPIILRTVPFHSTATERL